jgi:hypothetical protein
MELESQLIIRLASSNHITKGEGKFNADTIKELSNGFLDGSQDAIEWINSIKN